MLIFHATKSKTVICHARDKCTWPNAQLVDSMFCDAGRPTRRIQTQPAYNTISNRSHRVLCKESSRTVSYTHLDVYKRQTLLSDTNKNQI